MNAALAATIRLFARPAVSVESPDGLVIRIPALRLAGAHEGAFDPATCEERSTVAHGWMRLVFLLLPSVSEVAYDTAGGIVRMRCRPGSAHQDTARAVETLLSAGLATVVRFVMLERDVREGKRALLAESLARDPVDLGAAGGESALIERITAVLEA